VSKIILLDTGIGNIQSVANVLEYIGADFETSDSPVALSKASKIVFPGVGTYGNAMERIRKKDLYECLRKALLIDKKLCLGICVGMQVMSEVGYEFGEHQGLGVIPGVVKKIEVGEEKLRLPHVGWNNVSFKNDSPLFKKIPQDASFYFLHSYLFVPKEPGATSCTVNYGAKFTAAIERENIFGVQFHPEKSQEVGIQLIKNFVEL